MDIDIFIGNISEYHIDIITNTKRYAISQYTILLSRFCSFCTKIR